MAREPAWTTAWVRGYASLFGHRDGAGDIVRPGAFARSLARQTPLPMLWQHDPCEPIGMWTGLCEDRRGLQVLGRLNLGVARAREAAVLIGTGDLSGLSIGFKARRAQRDRAGRQLIDIDLWEISLVTFPQVNGARAQLLAPPSGGLTNTSRRPA
ncbi:HK97 family phage prohead protease [Roseibium hamelinense]|nr:HK97 family phage prohead protease [Roseibium hamelinense]MTI43692.1 HK97 family phage prohead protease [Roseibium hamelinense]